MGARMKRLPDSELEVMQAVWKCSVPAERKEIEEHLNREHPIALTTLLTLLSRLSEKEFIRIEKTGRKSVYYALITEKEYQAFQSARWFQQIFKGNIQAFGTALCDSGISKEDLEELKKMLENHTI